jgi:uncharacterized protein (DUF2147 family)
MYSYLLILVLTAVTLATEPKELIGKWYAVGQSASCEFKRENGKMQAYVYSNPKDPAMIGVHLFQNLTWNEKKSRWDGKVYDYSADKLWSGSFNMPSKDLFIMSVKFMGIGRSDKWARVKE